MNGLRKLPRVAEVRADSVGRVTADAAHADLVTNWIVIAVARIRRQARLEPLVIAHLVTFDALNAINRRFDPSVGFLVHGP